jgi:hypothetical protein
MFVSFHVSWFDKSLNRLYMGTIALYIPTDSGNNKYADVGRGGYCRFHADVSWSRPRDAFFETICVGNSVARANVVASIESFQKASTNRALSLTGDTCKKNFKV